MNQLDFKDQLQRNWVVFEVTAFIAQCTVKTFDLINKTQRSHSIISFWTRLSNHIDKNLHLWNTQYRELECTLLINVTFSKYGHSIRTSHSAALILVQQCNTKNLAAHKSSLIINILLKWILLWNMPCKMWHLLDIFPKFLNLLTAPSKINFSWYTD